MTYFPMPMRQNFFRRIFGIFEGQTISKSIPSESNAKSNVSSLQEKEKCGSSFLLEPTIAATVPSLVNSPFSGKFPEKLLCFKPCDTKSID